MENESVKVHIDPATNTPRQPPSRPPVTPQPVTAAIQQAEVPDQGMSSSQKRVLIFGGIFLLILIVGAGFSIWWLYGHPAQTQNIRDIFIIVMALVSMLMAVSLVILMIQLARLIVLLQNEIKPILDSTNEAVSNLRGTTIFLSDNLVEPVIKLNEYLAGFSQLVGVLGLGKKARQKRSSANK